MQMSVDVAQSTGRMRFSKSHRMKTAYIPFLMIIPSMVVVIGFTYYPAVTALYMGFFRWNGFNSPVFVGLSNFVTYVKSAQFPIECRNVSILIVGYVVIGLTIQLLAAYLVYNLQILSKWSAIYRHLLIIPMAIPPVVVYEIWGFIYNPQLGLLNELLRSVGLSHFTNTWLANPAVAMICIVCVGFPWISNIHFLIYLAGFQSIPMELREAYALEGKSWVRRLVSVEIPQIYGQVRLVIVMSIIAAIQQFVSILILTQGGPGYATMVPGTDMYNTAFGFDQYGLGMAIGTIMFLFILFLSVFVLRGRRQRRA